MKTIFLVKYNVEYEGFNLLGIFESRAGAYACAAVEAKKRDMTRKDDALYVEKYGDTLTVEETELQT